MRLGALALAGALLSCSGEQPQANRQAEDGALTVSLQSEDSIDGRRPLLGLFCGARRKSFWLELVRPPAVEPGRSFGSFKVDDGAPVRLPLTWLGDGKWRVAVDAEGEARLVRATVAGRNIYFSGPEGTTDRVYRWDLARLGDQREQVRQGCSRQAQPSR
ncbi:hypothetical protein [Sphingosinicella sp. YJ22]|uniref:hypothetical protein n=1 Tax=Sphingosinicella sp. YJ22 TaxID=1104780 RepID=UPI00140A48FD|nr:hypothetical protein [Sphingosinicella sp. YJ22]